MDIISNRTQEYLPPALSRFAEQEVAGPEAAAEPYGVQDAAAVAALLRLLSDATRLKLLLLLVNRELSVTQLCREMALPQPTVSHHLAWLRASSLVAGRRSGKNVFYGHGPAVTADGDWLSVGVVQIRLRSEA